MEIISKAVFGLDQMWARVLSHHVDILPITELLGQVQISTIKVQLTIVRNQSVQVQMLDLLQAMSVWLLLHEPFLFLLSQIIQHQHIQVGHHFHYHDIVETRHQPLPIPMQE
jgi:hypothetical protein